MPHLSGDPTPTPHPDRKAAIRALNDALRVTGVGGMIMLSRGIKALPAEQVTSILAAVAAFEAFTRDNDPYGEHDCAMLSVGDQHVLWKIDYYNLALEGHSPDPADPTLTRRVLTTMLAEEY